MENEQYIVALEIGSSKIVGAVATHSYFGGVSLIAIEEEKKVDCVRYGVIQNIDEVNNCVGRILKKLENRTKITPRKIQSVFIGVQGRSMCNIESSVSKHFEEETTITDEHIKQLRRECAEERFNGFDVEAVVPRKYIIDKNETKNPKGVIGSHIEAYFNIIVAKTQLKGNLKRLMDRQTVKVRSFLVTPLCVAANVLSKDERSLGCMLVDFGAETTTVSIYKNDVLIYLATIPLGSRNITKDITSLKVLEENAESIKKNIGSTQPTDGKPVMVEGNSSVDVNNLVAARSGEIIANILAQLEYAKLKIDDIPGGIILVGGGTKLKGFSDLLMQQGKCKVREGVIDGFTNIIDNKASNIEYVSVLALLLFASKKMAAGDSCCSEIKNPELQQQPLQNHTTTTTPQKEQRIKEKREKRNWMNRLKERMTTIFEESPEEENDDNNDEN